MFFSPPLSWGTCFFIYSRRKCILAIHLEVSQIWLWILVPSLPCQWYCLGVTLHLMRQGVLAGSIECGGDECFSKKVPSTFTCFTLLPSSAISLGALKLDPDLLSRVCSQGSLGEPFPTRFLVAGYLTLIRPKPRNSRAHLTSREAHPLCPFVFGLLPPTIYMYVCI